ncbi:hypothetical protein [Candidatus Rhodobacter oscarellae]|uniref:hypothetical protein n=1 Tax=Candidatus Rhodobacter oscarellae TaxID=1675527 RepID=UPI00067097D8|nr:hypothetical protein [Candidatus Rhodobacter lobularis]
MLFLLVVSCAVVLGLWLRNKEMHSIYASDVSTFLKRESGSLPLRETQFLYFSHFGGVQSYASLKRFKTYLDQVSQEHDVLAAAYFVSPSVFTFRMLIFFRREDQCFMSFLTTRHIDAYDLEVGCDVVDAAVTLTSNWTNGPEDYEFALGGASFGFTAWEAGEAISAYEFSATEIYENKEVTAEVMLEYLLEASSRWDFVASRP